MGILMKNAGHILNNLPSMLEESFPRDFFDWVDSNVTTRRNAPAVNIQETENSLNLEVAAPGIKKEDFHVEYKNDRLSISAQSSSSTQEEQEAKYTRREFSYQRFERSFKLPEKWIDSDNIQAKYENGILHVTIPKRSANQSDNSKRIDVA